MKRRSIRLASALAGATATAVVLAGTSGATHLGSLQLGHANTSTAQTSLTANLDTPVLKVVNQGGAAAVRGEAQKRDRHQRHLDRRGRAAGPQPDRDRDARDAWSDDRGQSRRPGRDELDRPGRGRRHRQEHGRRPRAARDRERGRASAGGELEGQGHQPERRSPRRTRLAALRLEAGRQRRHYPRHRLPRYDRQQGARAEGERAARASHRADKAVWVSRIAPT